MLLGANDEWQLQHRYIQVEALAELMAELMPPLVAGALTLDQCDAVPPQTA